MIENLMKGNSRLVSNLQNEQIYCIPKDMLTIIPYHSYETCREGRDSFKVASLKDLLTGELFLFPEKSLFAFAVPDEKIGFFIRRFEVRGIRTPYKMKPRGINSPDIPLYGNVTDPEWASIALGGTCNNNCFFCYTHWLRAVPNFSTSQVKDMIDRIADIKTIKLLNFSGGEPSIRQDLIALFEYGKHAGFSNMALQTNGRKLRNFELAEKLVELGLKTALLSIHGPNKNIHDDITGSPGSFVETLEGLRNLITLSIKPTVNIVMCRKNYKNLTEIVFLLGKILYGDGNLRFSYPIIEGAAFDNIGRVIVPLSQLKPLMLTAIRAAEEMGLEVQVANMPLCIPDSNHRNTAYDKIVLSKFVKASPFYKFNVPRGEKSVKLKSCIYCSKNTICRGIQVEYLRAYPNSIEEFKPME